MWCNTPRPGVVRIAALYTLAHISGADTRAPQSVVVVDIFNLADRHEVYDCPRLVRCGRSIVSPNVSSPHSLGSL